jgi:3-oxoacid CoA-transferase subunit A
MDKTYASAAEAVADIPTGASIAVGGFGVCGIPSVLIDAVLELGVDQLEVFSNNAGIDGWGLGRLLADHRLRRVVASYVGENAEFARQYLAGELEVELIPQGTLAERMRAGGAGIPGFYTMTGTGTQVAEGGLPWKYDAEGRVVKKSPAKDVRVFNTFGEPRGYVLEEAIVTDFALVRAAVGDRHGNLKFNASASNFNPVAAMAGRVAIAEVEVLVEVGELGPSEIDLPGIYVHRVVGLTPEQARNKVIEVPAFTERTLLRGSEGAQSTTEAETKETGK